MKKFSFLLTSLVLVCFAYNVNAKNATPHVVAEIAAVVNEEVILLEDLEKRLDLILLLSGRKSSKDFRKKIAPQVLNTMILESLQRQEATRFDIKASKTDILNAVKHNEHMNHQPEGYMLKSLKENKIPESTFLKQVEASIVWNIFISEKYHTSLQASTEEVDARIKQIELNKDKKHYHLAEIFIPVESQEQEMGAYFQTTQIIEHLQQGAPFSSVAQQFSQSASASRGGDIGWICERDLKPEWKGALETATTNTITQVIRSQNGFHILYVINMKDQSPESSDDTLFDYMQVTFPAPEGNQQSIQASLKKAEAIAQNARSCKLLKSLAESTRQAEVKEHKEALGSQMIPGILGILNQLPENKPSPVINSDIGVLLFMACKKTPIPAGEINRDAIERQLIAHKQNLTSQREMQSLKRAAYIDIRSHQNPLLAAAA